VLDPGDTGVTFLAGLTEPQFLPAIARVTMRFDRAPARTLSVPLNAFATKQHMGWPLRLDGRRWMTLNTAGTAHHWIGGTIVTPRAVFNSQRFAMDIVQIDGDGQTHPPLGRGKESYYAWSEDVLSVGPGRVVAVVKDQRDHEIGEPVSPTEHPAGNFVVIQHGPRLFSVYAQCSREARSWTWVIGSSTDNSSAAWAIPATAPSRTCTCMLPTRGHRRAVRSRASL